jgi:hypothetical protein
MPKSKPAVETDTRAFIREAMTWPSIREIAEEYGLREGYVRGVVERGKVTAVRLNVIHINPDSWDRFIHEVIQHGEY